MRVLIVGCGYVGIQLGAELVREGHAVWGLRRSPRADPEFRKAGIVPIRMDITIPESFPRLETQFEWVVLCVSASGGGAAEYDAVYLQGTRNLMSWLSVAPPAKFVYTSSTSVYGQTDRSWVTESSPTAQTTETGRILVETEELLLDEASKAGFPAVVLRVAGIYGPGRAYWLEQVRSGQVRVEGTGQRILNMIHRDDVVGSIITALGRGRPGQVYNAVDDEPVAQQSLLEWLSERLECPVASSISEELAMVKKRGLTNKRVSNRKLKEELGYCMRFPSFREGYLAILNS